MLALADRAECTIVYAASSTGRPGPNEFVTDSPYSHSKWVGEQLMLHNVYQRRGIVCRLFNVYGPRNDTGSQHDSVITCFERAYRKNAPPTIVGSGEQRRDFIHVNDVVSGLIAAAEKGNPGTTYELGTQVDFSINDVARLFGFDRGRMQFAVRSGEREKTVAVSDGWMELGWQPTMPLQAYIYERKLQIDGEKLD